MEIAPETLPEINLNYYSKSITESNSWVLLINKLTPRRLSKEIW